MITKKQLIPLVINEAKKLKKFATKKERSKLDFNTLHEGFKSQCIYGQLTGNCFNKRANNLFKKCTNTRLTSIDAECNITRSVRSWLYDRSFSPIERFICINDSNKDDNKRNLINYLQNKTRKLILK